MSQTCPDEVCSCGGCSESERLMRRARRLLDVVLADDQWVTLAVDDLLRIVDSAEELGDFIAFAQRRSEGDHAVLADQ